MRQYAREDHVIQVPFLHLSFDPPGLRSPADEQKRDLRQQRCRCQHHVEIVGQAHVADVGDGEALAQPKLLARCGSRCGGCRMKSVQIDRVLDQRDPLRIGQNGADAVQHAVGHADDVGGVVIRPALDRLREFHQRAVSAQCARRHRRFGPQVGNVEHDRRALDPPQPAAGQADEQRMRFDEDHVRALEEGSAQRRQQHEAELVQQPHARPLPRRGVDPHPLDRHAVDAFAERQPPAIALTDDAFGIIRHPGQHRHLMSLGDQQPRQTAQTYRRRAELRRIKLRKDPNLHHASD